MVIVELELLSYFVVSWCLDKMTIAIIMIFQYFRHVWISTLYIVNDERMFFMGQTCVKFVIVFNPMTAVVWCYGYCRVRASILLCTILVFGRDFHCYCNEIPII